MLRPDAAFDSTLPRSRFGAIGRPVRSRASLAAGDKLREALVALGKGEHFPDALLRIPANVKGAGQLLRSPAAFEFWSLRRFLLSLSLSRPRAAEGLRKFADTLRLGSLL